MRYRTTILECDGSQAVAELEAADEQSLHEQLHAEGRALLQCRQLDDEPSERAPVREVALGQRRLMLLTQAMQEAFDAGVPLLMTFRALGEQEDDPRIEGMLADLSERVADGQLLSDALLAHPRSFPAVYCALVRAGEESGSLPNVLSSIAGYLEWKLEIAGTVRQALVYPTIVLAAGYAMVLFMLSFVVPRLGAVIAKMSAELPAASRWLIDCSGFVQAHIVAIIIGSIAGLVTLGLLLRLARVRDVITSGIGRMPVARNVVATLAVAQLSRSMSVLLQAGLTMPHALELAAAGVVSPYHRAALLQCRERIIGGARLSDSVAEAKLLPPVATSILQVGEEAGRLPVTFEKLGRLYDREVKAAVKRALALLEPAVTVFLGIVVGGVAVLVVTTIYTAMKGIGK